MITIYVTLIIIALVWWINKARKIGVDSDYQWMDEDKLGDAILVIITIVIIFSTIILSIIYLP